MGDSLAYLNWEPAYKYHGWECRVPWDRSIAWVLDENYDPIEVTGYLVELRKYGNDLSACRELNDIYPNNKNSYLIGTGFRETIGTDVHRVFALSKEALLAVCIAHTEARVAGLRRTLIEEESRLNRLAFHLHPRLEIV